MTTGLVVVETRITTFFVVVSIFSVVVDDCDEEVLGIIDDASDVATGLNGIRDVGTENGEAVELEVKTESLNFAWSWMHFSRFILHEFDEFSWSASGTISC